MSELPDEATMADEQSEQRTYFLTPPTLPHAVADLGEPSILDGWLAEFDVKLDNLSQRQDAFFEKLGIKVVHPKVETESAVGASLEEK